MAISTHFSRDIYDLFKFDDMKTEKLKRGMKILIVHFFVLVVRTLLSNGASQHLSFKSF
jgi:predicted nucleotidyltransferase component of viral defense system